MAPALSYPISGPLFAGAAIGANPAVYIPPALGFDSATFPISPQIIDPGGILLATGDAGTTPEAMFDRFSTARSAPTTTYYVGAGGSDANSGLNTGAKKASIGGAITAANATTTPAKIILDGGMEFTRTLGLNGVSPTVDLYVTTASGRATFGMFEASSVYTFALDGTFTNCYSITLANADRVTDRLNQNASGWNKDLDNYASAAALNAATLTTAGGWVIDTGKLYIRRLDSAAPSYANTRIYRASGTNNFKITSAVNIFFENLDGEGGSNGVFDYQMSAQQSTTKVFVAKSCTARYGGGVVNTGCKGFAVNGMKGLMYLSGCDASANANDGINPHDTVASGQMVLTVNCSGSDNGRGTSTSNQGLTSHDGIPVIDLAGNYQNNRGGSVRLLASKMLCAGTYSTDLGDVALGGGTVPTSFYTDTGATMWCDRTKAGLAGGGSNTAYFAGTGSTIHRRNTRTAGAPNGGGGTIDTY